MARPVRIEFENALYHVMSRGNERRAIVKNDEDRIERLRRLREAVEQYGWILHAFCLMTNHDHLFVQTPIPNLGKGMGFLNGSYASWFNRRHRRVGHLFQGRYRAQLVEEEGHHIEVSRYIHLNPVRASMVARPEDYEWSSYRGYHRSDRKNSWVTHDGVLRQFGRNRKEARAAYRAFVRNGIDDPPESPFANAIHGILIGGDAFVQRMQRLLADGKGDGEFPQLRQAHERPGLDSIIEAVCDEFNADPHAWLPGSRSDGEARATVAWIARRRCGYDGVQVAPALGYAGSSSVSHAVKRIERLRTSGARDGRLVSQKLNSALRQLAI